MSWNYRIVKTRIGSVEQWAVREVYYDQHGNITHWTEDGVGPFGETRQEFMDDADHFFSALEQAPIDATVKPPVEMM